MSREPKIPGPDHPITIATSTDHVVVSSGGVTIADSRSTLVLREKDYAPVRYISVDDVDHSLLESSDTKTYCPYKGEASYFSVPGAREQGRDAVWFYAEPYEAVGAIKDHVAVYPDRVELSIDES
jgi:uncharacterized protein (DUF427 family)